MGIFLSNLVEAGMVGKERTETEAVLQATERNLDGVSFSSCYGDWGYFGSAGGLSKIQKKTRFVVRSKFWQGSDYGENREAL